MGSSHCGFEPKPAFIYAFSSHWLTRWTPGFICRAAVNYSIWIMTVSCVETYADQINFVESSIYKPVRSTESLAHYQVSTDVSLIMYYEIKKQFSTGLGNLC